MIEDYKVDAAKDAILKKLSLGVWSDDLAKAVAKVAIEAAANAKPPPQIVVTEEMIEAGCRAAWQETPWKVMMHRDVAISIYRAMSAVAPLPEVTDEAVKRADAVWCKHKGERIPSMKAALRAALPIILGRKP